MSEGSNPVGGSAYLYCSNCGAPTPLDAVFCAKCGKSVNAGVVAHPQVQAAPVVAGAGVYVPQAVASNATATGYAGFWLRLVAWLLDRILVGVVLMPFSFGLTYSVMGAGDAVTMPEAGQLLVRIAGLVALTVIAQWLYFGLMESSGKQATLGKMLLGIKVTDLGGERISFARASGRFFSKIISNLTLGIGYIMAGFTERKQALHDMIAGTLVVRRSN
jgi:uncharacterized RDD family membrane protein YckC